MKENLIEYFFFNIGDRVRIVPESRFYRGGPTESNPKDVTGTVYKLENEWISVKWDNDRKNGYEVHDLKHETEKPIILVDANKIYLSQEPSDLKHMLEILYPEDKKMKSQETYYKTNEGKMVVQCIEGRMRSFDDIWIIADTYFPNIDVATVFRELLLFNITIENVEKGIIPKQLANCSTMKRIRYTNSLCMMWQVWQNVDCGKFESVYKWRDLFNMLYINNLEQWKDWYRKELKPKEVELKPV